MLAVHVAREVTHSETACFLAWREGHLTEQQARNDHESMYDTSAICHDSSNIPG